MTTRKEYTQKLKSKLDEWNEKIDELETKLEATDMEARAEYQEQLQTLKSNRETLEQKVSELQDASGDAWNDIRAGAADAWEALDDALDRAISRFE